MNGHVMSPSACGRSPYRKPQPGTAPATPDLSHALARLLGWGEAPLRGVRLGKTGPFLLIVGAVLAAGCGGVTSAPRAAKSSGTPSVGGRPSGPPKQRAVADARAILGEFAPPPGAVRLAKQPALPGGWGKYPVMSLNSTAQADAVGYWRVSGAATALLAWEKAHISRSFSRQDVIIGPPSWNTVYSLPAVPGVLPTREMNVQVYDAGGGLTVIMADAMVSWQPPRPASGVIPASVTVATIAASGPWQGNPAPVTITSVPVVRRLVALVNGLPVSTVGMGVPCPRGAGFTLTFRAAAGGPAVAVADGPAECGVVHLRLDGKDEPDLQPPGSYRAAVLTIAGLRWKLG
jgi:hypothetical protein